MRGLSVALVAGVLLASPALAASPIGQLKDIDGKVYVNRGKGFVPARENTELFQGDRVMVGENGSASVNYYLAKCEVMLTASSMTTMAGKAPCKGGRSIAPAADMDPYHDQTSYGQIADGDSGFSSGGAVVVGLGLATMATTAIIVATDDDDRDRDDGQSP
jgi:hypothetical protein